jgi:hypothetical protein
VASLEDMQLMEPVASRPKDELDLEEIEVIGRLTRPAA